MLNTTTKNKKKLAHREIIHKWRVQKALMLSKGKLKYILKSTADEKIDELLSDIRRCQEAMLKNELNIANVPDGWDVFQEAYMYLLEMNKKGYWQLFDCEDITITMESGKQKDVTLAQGVGYHIRHYIYKWGQTNFKKSYIEDYSKEDDDGNDLNCYDVLSGLIDITRLYDISNYEEYEAYKTMWDIICENCTARQKLIFHYRMQEKSTTEIAEILGVRLCTISNHMKAMQKIVKEKFPEKANNIIEKWERVK